MNKLILASALVLGLASTSAFARDDVNASGSGANSNGGLLSIAEQTKTITKTDVDTKNSVDSHNYTSSYTDSGTHVFIGKLELDAAVSLATLSNASTGNSSDDASAFAARNRITKSASMETGAASRFQGLAQINVTAGANNVAQMSQQVSANIRSMSVN